MSIRQGPSSDAALTISTSSCTIVPDEGQELTKKEDPFDDGMDHLFSQVDISTSIPVQNKNQPSPTLEQQASAQPAHVQPLPPSVYPVSDLASLATELASAIEIKLPLPRHIGMLQRPLFLLSLIVVT